uniref:Uncharacterized protein n=1 Tax=Candidatus Kentrum sp. LPFa TaxID=2126335 RepID=A0A450XXX3_9GAMM|nr:MAG: hypothetical protein BECKLPF1236A_GA0070988_102479 [Candidatus Kentron sp. LPFa]VFK34106.1 MAG: hypothetical protein BECKLPF1236C_GA0070990_102449 [Candidatus Kentron sp. LPFa]
MEIYDVKKRAFLDKLDKDHDLDYFFTLYYKPTGIFLCSYHSAEEKEEYFTKYYGYRDYKIENINDDGFMDIRIIRTHLRCNLNSENDFPNEKITEIVDIVAVKKGFKRLPSKWIGKTDKHPQYPPLAIIQT